MITHISCKSSLLEPASQLSYQKVATEVCNSVESLKCVEHYYWCCSELLYRVLYCIGLWPVRAAHPSAAHCGVVRGTSRFTRRRSSRLETRATRVVMYCTDYCTKIQFRSYQVLLVSYVVNYGRTPAHLL